MRYVFVTIYLFFMMAMLVHLFSEETMPNSNDRHDFSDNEMYWQRYLTESEILTKEFRPISESLRNKGQSGIKVDWNEDYYNPLFEKSKKAALRITRTEDLRSAFESLILHGSYPLYEQGQRLYSEARTRYLYETLNFAGLSGFRKLDILGIISLKIITDHRKEIVQGTFYGDVKKQKELIKNRIENSRDGIWVGMLSVDDYHKLLQFEYPVLAGTPLSPFPKVPINNPFRDGGPTYEVSYPLLAIWSYKDDRARDFLFELATRSTNERFNPDTNNAVYYLPLFPNSGELLPNVKILLKEAIAKEQKDYPERAKYLLDENGELINPFQRRYPDSVFQKINGISVENWMSFAKETPRLFCLAQLVKTLEFTEKIPVEERERFNIFRRELLIVGFLVNPMSRATPRTSAPLQKGDEHFEIYLVEYGMSRSRYIIFHWEEDGIFYPIPLETPDWQKRKAFYERELAHPRPIYTEDQMAYIKAKLKEFENESFR